MAGTNCVLDVEEFIARLHLPDWSNPLMEAYMTESELVSLCKVAKNVFLSQPILLDLVSPVKVVGDICGNYNELLDVLHKGGEPGIESSYLFLGNYVNRGMRSLETIALLLAYKVHYPDTFFLLRGNQETAAVSRMFGFYEDCAKRYSSSLWMKFIECFECMPLAAVIEKSIFCVHGGLSPKLHTVDEISCIKRPVDVPRKGLLCDLLWSDPDKDTLGWAENDRGISYTFGPETLKHFMELNDYDLVVRGHQVVREGFEFFAGKRLLTLFSAANYCDFNNNSALLDVREDLECVLMRINMRIEIFGDDGASRYDVQSIASGSNSSILKKAAKNPYRTVEMEENTSSEGTVHTNVKSVITEVHGMPPEYVELGTPGGKIYDRIYAKYGCKAGLLDSEIPERPEKIKPPKKAKRVAQFGEVLMLKDQAKESCIEKIMAASKQRGVDTTEDEEDVEECSAEEKYIATTQLAEPELKKQDSCKQVYKPPTLEQCDLPICSSKVSETTCAKKQEEKETSVTSPKSSGKVTFEA